MSLPIALIGAGIIGQRHIDALSKSSRAHLCAIADPSDAAGRLAAKLDVPHFEDANTLCASLQPSGVIVATPTELHFAPSEIALSAGCDLLIEKPITATIEEAQSLDALARAQGRKILVGHQRRYAPQVQKARELIENGSIGQLVAVSGQWLVRKHDSYFKPDWRQRRSSGPVLINLIHEIDYLRFICGPIVSVTAQVSHHIRDMAKEDCAALTLRFASGALGVFILSDQTDTPWSWEFGTGENVHFPTSGQNVLRFAGTKGALDFPNLALWRSEPGKDDWRGEIEVSEFPFDLDDPYINQINHFADVVERKVEPIVDASDAAQTLRATLAVFDAAQSGKTIDLR